MNTIELSELLNELPDEMIVTAVRGASRRRIMLIRTLPAIAACLVIGLAAAIYPKLRMQTPEITEPPAAIVTTAATVQNTAETTAETTVVTSHTTAVSRTTARSATGTTAIPVLTETMTVMDTEPDPVQTDIRTESRQETEPSTETSAVTGSVQQHEISESTTLTIPDEPHTETVPIWIGSSFHQETAPKPHMKCRFNFFWENGIKEETAFDKQRIFAEYGIPEDIELTDYRLAFFGIQSGYRNTTLTGGELSEDELVLHISYSEEPPYVNEIIPVAIRIPEGYTFTPENFRAEYQVYTDADAVPKVESPTITIIS